MQFDYKYLDDFINDIAVSCPKCGLKARVISNPENRGETRFACSACGTTKQWSGNPNMWMWASDTGGAYGGLLFGPAVDCYFKIPLWYQTSVKGETLYAYNLEHLEFLYAYVADKLRERTPNQYGWSNQSLQSRLPKWMLAAKNRELVLQKLIILRKK